MHKIIARVCKLRQGRVFERVQLFLFNTACPNKAGASGRAKQASENEREGFTLHVMKIV